MMLAAAAAALLAATLTGCGGEGKLLSGTAEATTGAAISGHVLGGQQPIVGARVYLYAAGTGGYGSPSRSLLAAPGYVTTDANGFLSITGDYTCGPGDQVYLLALGGDPGSGPNSAVGLMAALGSCSTLAANAATTFVFMDEVTTVAAVYALVDYMRGPTAGGAPASDNVGLARAFAQAAVLANTTTGLANTATANGRGAVPQAAINSLANSLAACINSSGACSALFSATTVAGMVPTNTVQAALNVARHPSSNAAAIYNLATPQAPFAPGLLSAPATWTLPVTFAGDVLTYHNDVARTGVQSGESVLTPAGVNAATFGWTTCGSGERSRMRSMRTTAARVPPHSGSGSSSRPVRSPPRRRTTAAAIPRPRPASSERPSSIGARERCT